MSVNTIASRYAKSLIELAVEYDRLERVHEDIKALQRMLRSRDFLLLLRSPVIPEPKKNKALNLLLEGKIDDLTLKFLLLLVQKHRSAYLPDIIEAFAEQYIIIKNIATIKVTSAVKLSEETLQAIYQKILDLTRFEGKLEIVSKVDPRLIGGFILQYGHYLYDASVTKKLADMREKCFVENLYKSKISAR